MFVLYLSLLLLTEIPRSTEGALTFTQHPAKTVYSKKGQDAVLEWDYSADNKSAELNRIIWYAGSDPLMYEDGSGKLQFVDPMPQAYVGRVERIKPATLVIKTLTYKDTGSYKCSLQSVQNVPDVTSVITLTVTGVEPRVHVAEVGDSVNFICNATSVPGQNFTWMTNETVIVSDARRPIISASGSSQLTIKNITVADQGFYNCVATIGSHQQEFGSGFLQLPKGVTMCTTEVYHISVGSRLSLSCSPDIGYPIPIVTWKKYGTLLQKEQNNMYTIANVTEEYFGIYTCYATGLDTSVGPCNKSVLPKQVDEIVVKSAIHGTVKEPAYLEWAALAGTEFYAVKSSGSDLHDDYVMVGTQTSLEFHYHTLAIKAQHQPEQTVIRAEVLAISNYQVIGKTQTYHELTIPKPIDIEV